MDNKVVCVVGPTACGKTKMGVALAQRFGGEVVSVDSMQLYRGMTVGTAAPTAEEMEGVPHHMVAVADPAESWSVARYVREADACVQDILRRGKRPVLVGGTGLYLDALVRGQDFAAGSQGGEIRRELQERLAKDGAEALLEALEGLLGEGYQPGGDLLLALSMDGLSGGAGARSIAAHLKARSLSPCFVLDHGGYATMEAFRTYLPKNAPLALIGICEKGEIQGRMTADREVSSRPGRERARPVDELLRAGARLTRRPRRARLCAASETMLSELGKKAPLLQRWLVRRPRLTFPLMRLLWRKRSVFHQFFVSERTVCEISAPGTPQTPAAQASLTFRQTLIPGVRAAEARHRIRCLAGNEDLRLSFSMCEDAGASSDPSGEAWEALETAIEIQFERAVIVPCLSPFVTDGRFYAQPGGRVYRFSPFLLTGEEALSGMCTVTDGTLQTAVQFFRSMLCV